MKQNLCVRLDYCSRSFMSSLQCPLPCNFVAHSTTDVGLGCVTYLANGMLEYVMGAEVFNVFE